MSTRAAQKEATRVKLSAVARAAFQHQGFEEVTFRALAKQAGVSTGSFFSCWKSKNAMYEEVMGRPAPNMADFLARVAVVCSGYPGDVGILATDAEELRRHLVGGHN